MKLAVWRIDGQQPAKGDSQQLEPLKVGGARIGLEKHLEDWIAKDVTLIAEGLTLVGRQISIDDGRLDLLAIDSRDRWVVIEVKPGRLDSGALTQALYYASSIARLSADELYGKLEDRLHEFGDKGQLSARVEQLLEEEQEGREIAVLLVGAGIHPGLERMSGFLGGFGVPISVVSFDVFELDGGPKLLIREAIDEPPKPTPARRKLTVEAIRSRAMNVGAGRQFDRFESIAQAAGLAVQPQQRSVRIAPPSNRTRFLMYARPCRSGTDGGGLVIHVGPKQFAEFFPHLDETEADDALKGLGGEKCLTGKDLDDTLDRIEQFLTDKIQQPETD